MTKTNAVDDDNDDDRMRSSDSGNPSNVSRSAAVDDHDGIVDDGIAGLSTPRNSRSDGGRRRRRNSNPYLSPDNDDDDDEDNGNTSNIKNDSYMSELASTAIRLENPLPTVSMAPPLSQRVQSSHSLIGLGMLQDLPSSATSSNNNNVVDDVPPSTPSIPMPDWFPGLSAVTAAAAAEEEGIISTPSDPMPDWFPGLLAAAETEAATSEPAVAAQSRDTTLTSASYYSSPSLDGQSKTGHVEETMMMMDAGVSPFTPTSHNHYDDDNEEEANLNDVYIHAAYDDDDEDDNDNHQNVDCGDTATTPPQQVVGNVNSRVPQSLSPPLLTNYSSNRSEADASVVLYPSTSSWMSGMSNSNHNHTNFPLPASSSLPPPSSSSVSSFQNHHNNLSRTYDHHPPEAQPQSRQLPKHLPQYHPLSAVTQDHAAAAAAAVTNTMMVSSNSSIGSLPSVVFPPSSTGPGGNPTGGQQQQQHNLHSRNNNNNSTVPMSRPPRARPPTSVGGGGVGGGVAMSPPPPSSRRPRSSSSVTSHGTGTAGERKTHHNHTNHQHQPNYQHQHQYQSTNHRQNHNQHQHHHRRTNTDSSNFSLVSALTDASGGGGDFVVPRRRTLSWDNNDQYGDGTQPPRASNRNNGPGNNSGNSSVHTTKTTTKKGTLPISAAPGTIAVPGTILQPVLFDGINNFTLGTDVPDMNTSQTRKPKGVAVEPSLTVQSSTDHRLEQQQQHQENQPTKLSELTNANSKMPSELKTTETKSKVGNNELQSKTKEGGDQSDKEQDNSKQLEQNGIDNTATAATTTSHKSPEQEEKIEERSTIDDVSEREKFRYTVSDVIDSSNETVEETEVLMSAERTRLVGRRNDHMSPSSNQHSPPAWRQSSFLSNVNDEEIANTLDQSADLLGTVRTHGGSEKAQDQSPTDQNVSSTKKKQQSVGSDSISHLTKRLMQLSPTNAHQHLSSESTESERVTNGGQWMAERNATSFYEDAKRLYPRRKSPIDDDDGSRDIEGGDAGAASHSSTNDKVGPTRKITRWICGCGKHLESDVKYFWEFMEPIRPRLWKTLLRVVLYLMIPSAGIAFILFYLAGNPPTGKAFEDTGCKVPGTSTCQSKYEKSIEQASTSWWLLFLGSRQVITFSIAKLVEIIVIDFATFRTRSFPRIIGTELSLALSQSRGWPFISLSWGITNLILLYGPSQFARHWLYWQNVLGVFNEENPSGNVTNRDYYKRWIYILIIVGVVVTIKRIILGNLVGKRVVMNYKTQLAKLMKKLLLVSEVASLSVRKNERGEIRRESVFRVVSMEQMYVKPFRTSDLDEYSIQPNLSYEENHFDNARVTTPNLGVSTATSNVDITELLEEWEEPELQTEVDTKVTTTEVLHFRRALDFIDMDFPFTSAFGAAGTRKDAIESSQCVFERLVGSEQRDLLNFEVLCQIAELPNESTDKDKIRDLIRLFRPSRNGEITKLDFVKSVDGVYKDFRLLVANISNSSQIDQAYEKIVNYAFYTIFFFIILAVLGVDVNAIFITITGLLVSFAFLIGTASSKYLEGVLLILVRRPYDIGDRVCFFSPTDPVDNDGPPSGGYIIEKVDLYSTTVRLATTREYTTFSNGSLADSRIVNLQRSVKANVSMYLKFTINATKKQLKLFKQRLLQFLKNKPREWIKLNTFRCLRIETDQQYMEYILIAQHRESWQNYITVQQSKGEVFMFALDLQRELKMTYTAPRLPVDLHGAENRDVDRSFLAIDSVKGTPEPATDRTNTPSTTFMEDKKTR